MISDRFATLLGAFKRVRPPDVVLWLTENIRLPRDFTPTPGPVSLAGRPYMREILECFHPDSGVTDVVVSAGTQLMKTTILALGMAFRIVFEPTSKLIVVPTKEDARDRMAPEKVHPLINENPVLARLRPASGDDFTKTRMAMLGGTISMVGVNSPTGLGGRTIGMVLQDEVCKYKQLGSQQSPEAHPMALADERTKLFGRFGFRYKSSTPTVVTHPFWNAIEHGDQTEFQVPCQNCSARFPLTWVDDKDSGYRSLTWSADAKNASGQWLEGKVRDTAKFICPKCGYPHSNHEKPGMIDAYEVVRANPLASASFRSFIVPSFYAPNISFGDMAWKYLSELNLFGEQNFRNSWLALPYSQISIRVGDEDVRRLVRSDYKRRALPFKARYLIMTADPGQTTGVHWMVCGVSDADEIAVMNWGAALSETHLPQIAVQHGVSRGLCDSRYNTDAVLQMCHTSGGLFWPTLGRDAPYGTYNIQPVKSHPGLELVTFVDHTLKNELYDRRIKRGGEPRVYLPADADTQLLGQLSGQQFDALSNRWKRRPSDHLGDCLKQVVLFQWVLRGVQAHIPGPENH